MTKKDLQSSIAKSLKQAMRPPKQHKHAKIKNLLGTYQKEAWKAKPNYNLMKDVTKQIKQLRRGKSKW